MGIEIARAAAYRGANVTLVLGPTSERAPRFVQVKSITSAQDMFEAVTAVSEKMDIIIKAAAVADYTPLVVADQKLKKGDGDMQIPLKRTRDILAYLGEHKTEKQVLCGFSMETEMS